MSGFDRFLVVDWSGGKQKGPRPCKDAIWIGECTCDGEERPPLYQRSRGLAEETLSARIDTALTAGERLFIGFDFPFGYPAGFARALTGSADPLAIWAWLERRIEDSSEADNRFEVAAGINRRLGGGRGPFWGRLGKPVEGLAATKAQYANPFPEKRLAEQRARGAFTCWQLAYAGAVGSQVLMGLPVLERLRRRFPGQIAAWPYDPLDRPVALVEIWPTLIDAEVRRATGPGDIRDAVQVRLLARALSRLGPGRLNAMLDVRAPEEGWIFGLGHETELLDTLAG